MADRQTCGRQPHYEVNGEACLKGRDNFSVSHVRAAEMKLKQNNLVDLCLKFCFSFISVSFYMCARL